MDISLIVSANSHTLYIYISYLKRQGGGMFGDMHGGEGGCQFEKKKKVSSRFEPGTSCLEVFDANHYTTDTSATHSNSSVHVLIHKQASSSFCSEKCISQVFPKIPLLKNSIKLSNFLGIHILLEHASVVFLYILHFVIKSLYFSQLHTK